MFTKLTRSERVNLIIYLVDAETDVWNVYHDGTRFWAAAGTRDSARALANELSDLAAEVTFGMGTIIDE